MLPDLQLLPPEKARDSDVQNVRSHLETLLLLTTTRQGREVLRAAGVYAVVRETHVAVEDEGVREVAERVVHVLMRDEEGEDAGDGGGGVGEEGEEDKIVEIF